MRISLEELRARPGLHGKSGAHEVVKALSDYPDLWNVKMDSSPSDCPASRFAAEGSHEPVIEFVRGLTGKPVVGVGRITSPDTMVSQIRRGVLDSIGAARPSIADPFLPRKIDAGRADDIRQCIGCNICIASWHEGVPIRCTQNATVGEEWRRGWHPEKFVAKGSNDHVLIVGAGPAGLECALTLGRRFYEVAIADRNRQAGGRLLHEAAWPRLATWRRALDYRLTGLRALANVSMYLDSEMNVEDILAFGAGRVVIATGVDWTRALYDARLEVVAVSDFDGRAARLDNIFTGASEEIPRASLVIVGHRAARNELHSALHAARERWTDHGIRNVACNGDAAAPGAIVHAIQAGALYARGLDMPHADLPYAIDEPLAAAGELREIA